jgi:hypothetical protein
MVGVSEMITTTHVRIDLKGAIRNWTNRAWKNCVSSNGKTLSPDEVKMAFLEEISKGHNFIPCCEPSECPDFDYVKNGCPGHIKDSQ